MIRNLLSIPRRQICLSESASVRSAVLQQRHQCQYQILSAQSPRTHIGYSYLANHHSIYAPVVTGVMAPPMSQQQLYQVVTDTAAGKIEPRSGVTAVVEHAKQYSAENLEEILSGMWATVFGEVQAATPSSAQGTLSNLVDFMALLSEQDDLTDNSGSVVKIHGETVWRDLPMFGWDVNSTWNSLDITSTGAQRQTEIASFLNDVRFVALLIKTRRHPFTTYDLQALWTFRAGLETPTAENTDIDIWIPAVAIFVDDVGSQLAISTEEFAPKQPGQGRAGRGGPLWQGRDGFSPERWAFWRQRLDAIRDDSNVEQRLRDQAGQTSAKMTE